MFFGNFTTFNVKTIYNNFKIRLKISTIPFSSEMVVSFSTSAIFSRLVIGNLVYIKVIIKIPFCLLYCLAQKLRCVLYANLLRNEYLPDIDIKFIVK